MNDVNPSATSILLPAAGVDLFIRDKETANAARSLVDDWRFARVTVSVEEGDVETAIQSYQQMPSPALIIIETDTTDEGFTKRLEELSSFCSEGTSAIVIGPVNDVNLYRRLTAMGVSDYLVRPVPLETLSEVIAQGLIKQLGASDSRLIGVIGAKGGVGVSALTQAMAWGVSEQLGHKTFLLDAAGGWSSLGVGMGFEPGASLNEAVRAAANKDQDTLKRMLHSAGERLKVLASGHEAMLEASVQAPQYETLLDMVMASYPVVMVDLSAAIPSLKRTVINRAHELVVVTTPTLPALRATRTLMNEVKVLHGGSVRGMDLVVNMHGLCPGKEVPLADIATALEHKPDAVIPFDPKLFVGAENEGKKLNEERGGNEIIERLLPLARKVVSASPVESDHADEKGKGLHKMLGKLGVKR